MMEPDWPLVSADHCNEKKPIQTYRLVPIDDFNKRLDYLNELSSDADDDYTQTFLDMFKEERPVERRLFDSDSDDYDLSYQPDEDIY